MCLRLSKSGDYEAVTKTLARRSTADSTVVREGTANAASGLTRQVLPKDLKSGSFYRMVECFTMLICKVFHRDVLTQSSSIWCTVIVYEDIQEWNFSGSWFHMIVSELKPS